MKKLLNTKILLSFATIIVSSALIIGAAFAFLSDTETSADNTFEAGVLDLQIDNKSYYNGAESPNTTWELDSLDQHLFFDFQDLKPGDWGEDTISIHVSDNPAWGCFDSTLTSDDDNGSNEPELLVDEPDDPEDNFDGELGSEINFIFWVDDGDNVLEENEAQEENIIAQGTANEVLDGLSVTLADSIESLFVPDGEALESEETYYIGKAWCFGGLGLDPVTDGQGVDPTVDGGITCDSSGLDNSTQTDRLTADITFSTIQERSNPDFTCEEQEFSCTTEDEIFASSFSDNNQGTRKNGDPINPDRTDPNDALGAPQSSGDDFDSPVPNGEFFSLGFENGDIILEFPEPFHNGPGDDLQVFEITGGTSYPEEDVKVEVSLDGSSWTEVASAVTRDGSVDIDPVDSAQYVRLTDVSDIDLFEDTADGYDLDAVKAFCTVPEDEEPTPPDDQENGGIVINEVYYRIDQDHRFGSEAESEWAELYNSSNSAVDLTGWSIEDNTSCDEFTGSPIIPAGGFAVVTTADEATFESVWTSVPASVIYVTSLSAIGNGMANNDELMLRNGSCDEGSIVDHVSWGAFDTAFDPSVDSVGSDGISIERDPDGVDTNTNADFTESEPPTPGS